MGLLSESTLPIKIAQSGKITWSPGNIIDTSCDIDTTYYPFDEQTCSITLTTRGYKSHQLTLSLDEVPLILSAYQENGEWLYLRSSASTAVVARGTDYYSQVNFDLIFQRRNTFHLLSTILPMFFLVSMTCFVFKIPVDAGEKLGYCLTVLLAFAVYLTLISDNIPTTSTNTSYLSMYIKTLYQECDDSHFRKSMFVYTAFLLNFSGLLELDACIWSDVLFPHHISH